MFKRLFWLAVGTGLGFGMSFWIMRTVRSTIERYTPERVSSDLSNAMRGLGADIRSAVSEGRQAMSEREAELRESLGTRR
ncbi:MAG TPA: hypothetical protein VNF50_04570 [Acidimicrobiales bacterium]|nr:hypothetical protein [Acidimicrobiales bacterium]